MKRRLSEFVVSRVPALQLLSGGAYPKYVLGNWGSLTGTWIQRVVCAWLVWQWTESGFWLGVLASADMLPALVIAPFAGLAADRWSRLKINRLAQIMIMVVAALIAAFEVAGLLSLELLLVLVFLQGCATAAAQPARLALVQQLVPREHLGTAVAFSSVVVNTARLTGPAIAGVMILNIDIAFIFAINALLTGIFVIVMSVIRIAPQAGERARKGAISEIVGGFRYVVQQPTMRLVMAVNFLGGALVRSVWELLPAFASRNFQDSAVGLSVLMTSLAVGAILAGLTAGRSAAIETLATRGMASWGIAATFAIGFGLVIDPILSCLLGAAVGHFVARGLIDTQTFVQIASDESKRGRVLSIHGQIARGSPAIGAILLGIAIDAVGLAPTMAGASLIVVAVLSMIYFRRIV